MDSALIIGGSSGLGLEIAKLISNRYRVNITGRKDPREPLNFYELNLSKPYSLSSDLDNLLNSLPKINLLVYSAGYYQEGKIDELTDEQIVDMNYVGLIAPQLILRRLIKKQGRLDGLIAITSTSQFNPREKEPVYTGVKAGLAMFAKSAALDSHIGKVLVAAPAAIKTPFWKNTDRDTKGYLDPKWVAERIVDAYNDDSYKKFAEFRIFREPPRVEFKEKN